MFLVSDFERRMMGIGRMDQGLCKDKGRLLFGGET